jgi:hypothetical protein
VVPPPAGISALPLLAGLAAIIAIAALLASQDEDGEINLPISP